MSDYQLHLKVSTPKGVFLEEDVEELIVAGTEGYFGIQTGHTAFISTIKPGILSVFKGESQNDFAIHNGFVAVKDNLINILTETIEEPEDVDIKRAKEARARAKKRLSEMAEDTDLRRAETALRRALARLEIS